MATLRADFPFIPAGAVRQNHRLHDAGGDVADVVVAKEANPSATDDSDCSFRRHGRRDGIVLHLVGKTPGKLSAKVRPHFQLAGTFADCHPGRVVLCRKIDLAR